MAFSLSTAVIAPLTAYTFIMSKGSTKPIFLFFLSLRGSVDISFDQFGPFSVTTCAQELSTLFFC